MIGEAFGSGISLLFFLWVSQNCQLPRLASWLNWPWSPILPTGCNLALDAALIAAFYTLHSVLVGLSRPTYLILLGAQLLMLFGCWQHTPVPIWELTEGLGWNRALVGLVFAFHLYLAWSQCLVFGDNNGLITSGVRSIIRHPMHLCILLEMSLATVMTPDRLLLLGCTALYLCVAIPIEERRLIAKYPAYEQYRKTVPALAPRILRQRIVP